MQNLLLQIDTPYLPKVFTPNGNGLWCINLSGVELYEWGGVKGSYSGLLQINPSKIGSIRIALTRYAEVSSELECWANPKTWYYDAIQHVIYVNVCDSTEKTGYQIPSGRLEVGIIYGYSTHVDYTREDEAYYDNEYYEPSVSAVSDITNKRDRVFYDNVAYSTVNVELRNQHGRWDGQTLSNRIARVYALPAGGEISDGALLHSGAITKPEITNTKVTFTIDNDAKSLDSNIDLGRINTATYPHYAENAEDEPEDVIFPVAVGPILNYQPRCTNKGEEASAFANYALCKTYAGYQLRDVQDVWITLTKEETNTQYDLIIPASGQTISEPKPLTKGSKYAEACLESYTVDFTTGMLILPRGVAREADISGDEITYDWRDINVNFFGWSNTRVGENKHLCGVDLLRIGIEVFGGVDYEAWNFDLSAWDQERIKSRKMCDLGWTCSVLIDGDMTKTDFLKSVCQATHSTYKLRGDNRYTVKVYESEDAGAIKYEIQPQELFDRVDNLIQDTSEVLSTVKIVYGAAGSDENKNTLTDASLEEEIKQTMHISKSEEFETIHADKTGAQLKASALLAASLTPPSQSKFIIWANAKNAALDVGDTITAPRDRNNSRAIYNITSVGLSKSKGTVAIIANWIANIAYTGYIQGNLFGVTIPGIDAYSATTYTED